MDLANFIQDQILFYISIILVLFLPGYFLLMAVFGKKYFSGLEKFVISFGLSIASVNFLLILLGKAGFLITRNSVLIVIILFSAVCWVVSLRITKSLRITRYPLGTANFTKLRNVLVRKLKNCKLIENCKLKIVNLDSRTILIILLLFLTIFIKTAYLKNSIFPTSTDLGHHMYWSKMISETGQLPIYEKSGIIEIAGHYQISDPQPIADFIIGEHLIFSAINLISGIDFISYFPSLILLLTNIMSILAMFILVLKLFENNKIFAQRAATLTLLFIGPLYAIASPQVKFVSGGVIGNILGNLFISLALYFYFRAFKEKESWFLATALFLTAVMFYTHHLSSFIFIFILAFAFVIFLIFNIRNISWHLKSWMKLIFSPPVISCVLLATCYLLLIYAPAYIQTNAVETAVGGPSKATRAGLTFSQLKFSAGEARMALGILGLALLLWNRRRKTYAYSIILGWLIALFAMSLKPQWLYLDIPSGRIANYISYPLAIASAFAFIYIFSYAQNSKNKKYYISPKLLFTTCSLLLVAFIINGFYDNSQSLNAGDNSTEALQTFHASSYLTNSISENDIVLKDHNYITADTWIKLYFMRDYSFPFSRSYFKRYEDLTKKREQCTLQMISGPDSSEGKECFMGTGVNFVMVNPRFDSAQFEKSDKFWRIYAGDEIDIYYRN